MISLHLVPRENITMVWPLVIGLLKPSVDRNHGSMNERDLYEAVISGDEQLWAGSDGAKVELALTTKIVQFPRNRSLLLHNIGGANLSEYLSFLKDIESWGKENDCDFVEIYGRKGWAKILKGWDAPIVLLRKKL